MLGIKSTSTATACITGLLSEGKLETDRGIDVQEHCVFLIMYLVIMFICSVFTESVLLKVVDKENREHNRVQVLLQEQKETTLF